MRLIPCTGSCCGREIGAVCSSRQHQPSNAARRGSEGPWAPLRRLLTRSRMASLSQEAEDQINRLYLASPALRAELDSDIELMMACAAETRQAS